MRVGNPRLNTVRRGERSTGRERRRRSGPAGPGRWLVCIPAWGERCVSIAAQYTVPAVVAALKKAGRPATIFFWTDQPGRFTVDPEVAEAQFFDVPGPDMAFESLSNCHREMLTLAQKDERVLLLTADMVVSHEVIATCEQHLSNGKTMICCIAPRALETEEPPVGATGRALLEWAWDNRHPMTRDCTWPDGHSFDVWRMYFEKDGNVIARAFLPHPLACIPFGKPMRFSPTIDVNLTWNYAPSETYMITQPEEGAAVEVSPKDKEYVTTKTIRERLESPRLEPSCPSMIKCNNGRHRIFWEKRVLLRGVDVDCDEVPMRQRILGF